MKTIGIYGFGCVGQGLYEVLNGAVNDLGVIINKICVKDKNKPRKIGCLILHLIKVKLLKML